MRDALERIAWIGFREIRGYFASPQAYVFIAIFLLLSGFFLFAPDFGNFLATNEATLASGFFAFQPWLFVVLAPPLAARLWAEERRGGTDELLFTAPVSVAEAVIGKFLAAWAMFLIALALTFPMVITVNWLGSPDNGAILAGYIGAAALAAAYLAIGCATSAVTANPVISFIFSVAICLFLLLCGYPSITDAFSSWAPLWVTDLLGLIAVPPRFFSIQNGVIDLRDATYFLSLTALGLFCAGAALDARRRAWN